MKRRLFFCACIAFSAPAIGQSTARVEIKEVDASLVRVNDALFASRYEVSNTLYQTFVSALKQSDQPRLLAVALLDTLQWTAADTYNPPYAEHYHKHPAYDNFPVVNVSHEGAELFCDWLTTQYNSDPKRKFKKVLFRLPTEEEWMAAARAGDNNAIYPWEGNSLRNKKGQVMYNFKRQIKDTLWVEGKYVENLDVTAPVKSYWANNFGIYNMGGNAAEMVQEKTLLKGGSWRDDSEYIKVKSQMPYDGTAQPSVGFRYFAEVLQR